jgi:myo-inositol-1(or 4)-monophosphatase
MSKEQVSEFFDECLALTINCGKVIKEAIVRANLIQSKSCDIDLVTETDQEVENLLIGGLKKKFPTHKFIGEESVASGEKCVLTDDPTWIIDPVDGTMNFVHGLPLVAISIALLINKTVVIGIIYNPMLDQMFTAKLGEGAFLNGDQIRVSGQEDLGKSLVCSEVGTSKDPEKNRVVVSNLTRLIGNVHGLRALGSAALNMASVAASYTDAYYEFGIHAWDISAGDLIVREAGGCVLDTTGGPLDLMSRRVICASSEALALKIAGVLEQFELERD